MLLVAGGIVTSDGERVLTTVLSLVGVSWDVLSSQAISYMIHLLLGGLYIGMNFLRNFLVLSVCLPDPSILMRYW